MNDLIFVVLMVLFFAATAGLLRLCQKLREDAT